MVGKNLGGKFVLRLDKGQEIIQAIKNFCSQNQIKAGVISGIGAANKVSLKFFQSKSKQFVEKSFAQEFEVTSLVGNISKMNGEVYIHLHINLSDENFHCFGGHLSEGFVSATLEVMIDPISGKVDRYFDESVGLNLIKLDQT